MTKRLTILVLISFAAPAYCQSPAVDDLLASLEKNRKQKTEVLKAASDLDKAASELAAEIKSRLESLSRRLDEINGKPVPAPPNPNPTPTPPTPPVPVDTFVAKIKAQFETDSGTLTERKSWAVQLSGYYSAAVAQKMALDETCATAGDLIGRIQATSTLEREKLTKTRTFIGQEIAAIIGEPSSTLTKEKRDAIHAFFGRVESALDEVAK